VTLFESARADRGRQFAVRIGTPNDIANAVLFAMTSDFLTGETLHIDGGEPLT
jgi:NAD(P)-dependent dehydrogenase (short-subunit alcohol dehydrogenase family)